MLKYFDILKKKMKYKVSQCSCFYNQLRSDLFETFLKNVSLQWNQTREDAKLIWRTFNSLVCVNLSGENVDMLPVVRWTLCIPVCT